MYQKEIIYMGLYKDGSRVGSAGFVKVENRERESRFYLKIQNIPLGINGRFPIRIYNGSDWKELSSVSIQNGGGGWEESLTENVDKTMIQVMMPGGYVLEGKSKSALAPREYNEQPHAKAKTDEIHNASRDTTGEKQNITQSETTGKVQNIPQTNTLREEQNAPQPDAAHREQNIQQPDTIHEEQNAPQMYTLREAPNTAQRDLPREGENIVQPDAARREQNIQQSDAAYEERNAPQTYTLREAPNTPQPGTARKTTPERIIVTEELPRRSSEDIGETPQNFPDYNLREDKWEQILATFENIHPYGDERTYVKLEPKDFVILQSKYQHLVNNSFLLHGFYNYRYIILGKEQDYYLGVPGVYYEREKMVAQMFGFEAFECPGGNVRAGEFGYYLRKVEL